MPGAGPPQSIALFAHERGDARVRKRIAALQDNGWRVSGFTFHRPRDKAEEEIFWDNTHLGTTYNRRYLQRLLALAASLRVLWRRREKLRSCRAIYAVNMDNAFLAWLACRLCRVRLPLVLEIADVQAAMAGPSLRARLLRAVERFILRRSALLVTTSPGFVREYFQPIQRHHGPIFLLENTVYPSIGLPAPSAGSAPVKDGKPWVVGCFGAFRCARSLAIMKQLCRQLPGKVEFLLRGYPAGTIADDFPSLIAGEPAIRYEGPYDYPEDLAALYGSVDFNWCFDESDPNGNSAWLLPNRIYEGGLFHVPALAATETETGRWIEQNHAGFTFPRPGEEHLADFLRHLTVADWRSAMQFCRQIPPARLVGEAGYAALADHLDSL